MDGFHLAGAQLERLGLCGRKGAPETFDVEGYVHLLRGNAHGAITLLRRGARRVKEYPVGTRGIETGHLATRLEADAAAVESGRLVPGPDATVEPPEV